MTQALSGPLEDLLQDHPQWSSDASTQDHVWDQAKRMFVVDNIPFDQQWTFFQQLVKARPRTAPPLAAWSPEPQNRVASNIGQVMRERGVADYRTFHDWTARKRAEYWRLVLKRLQWPFRKDPKLILANEDDAENPQWLPGAEYNAADACFQAPRDKVAIVTASERDPTPRHVTYGELEALTNRFANGFVGAGFQVGDPVALYMPMNVECVAAYLGIVRAGGVVVSVADSFAPMELSNRVSLADAKAIVTIHTLKRGSSTIALYEKVKQADAPTAIVLPGDHEGELALREGDTTWTDFLSDSTDFTSVAGPPERPTNILFSSGTTGDPKAIPWTQLTPIKAAADGHFHQDIHAVDVVGWPTNIGWMMGPWLIYASLVNHAAMALYEGAPTTKGFCRFLQDAGITIVGLVPSIVRKWKDANALDDVDLGNVRVFTSTGEASNAHDYLWLMSRANYDAPIIEYLGGTEIGGGHITGTVLQPASPATFTTPALGLDFVVLDESGQQVGPGQLGQLFLIPPSIGLSQRLLNRDHHEEYYADSPEGPRGETLRSHGDEVQVLAGGYWAAQGRADDTMNLGGIKVASVELERAMDNHGAISETAAVAVRPGGGGADQLVVFAVTREHVDESMLQAELQELIKTELNPLFRIHDVVVVDELPRTASNKIMRRRLRARYTE